MTRYDFIIAGAGAAGLSLACHLLDSPLCDRSILLIDKDDQDQMHRNWGFWVDHPTLFDRTAHHTWDHLQFVSDGIDQVTELRDFRYHLIRGTDFYHFVLDRLAAYPNVTFLRGAIDQIDDGTDEARVTVEERTYAGAWVFDSLLKPGDLRRAPARYRYLKMHFKGWEIVTPQPAFNPRAATLFDFRTPQNGAMRFFYVMPFSEWQALVEYTIFSTDVLKREEYERALRDYIETVRGIREYKIEGEENGVVPITDCWFSRRAGRQVMTIGSKGGQIKPSSGYSFTRVQHDSQAIVRSLITHGHPFRVPGHSAWYRLADSVMLEIMQYRGEQVKPLFTALFRNNPLERIFRFLDEIESPWQQLKLIASLPKQPFVAALGRVAVEALRGRQMAN